MEFLELSLLFSAVLFRCSLVLCFLYRYLLQPGEEHNDQHQIATDRIWSKGTYRLREIAENPANRVMYYLLDRPERAFVSEELMLIPEDTELPPDYVQEW